VELLEKGERVVQETRGWDDAKQKTFSQRSKEDAQDYRYMPDADIPPIVLTDEEIQSIQAVVPMLPSDYRTAWQNLALDSSVINKLLSRQIYAVIMYDVQQEAGDASAIRVANWLASTIKSDDDEAGDLNIKAETEDLIVLAAMTEANELSSTNAKAVFNELIRGGKNPRQIAEANNMLQVSDEGEIAAIVDEVLSDPESQKAVEDIRSGNDKAIGYLVGQIMKKSAGKANPGLAQKLIREKLT